jgi:hypothetical protein
MPKLKAGTSRPTPAEDAAITAAAKADPDTQSFTDAEWAEVAPPARHGPLGSDDGMAMPLTQDP